MVHVAQIRMIPSMWERLRRAAAFAGARNTSAWMRRVLAEECRRVEEQYHLDSPAFEDSAAG